MAHQCILACIACIACIEHASTASLNESCCNRKSKPVQTRAQQRYGRRKEMSARDVIESKQDKAKSRRCDKGSESRSGQRQGKATASLMVNEWCSWPNVNWRFVCHIGKPLLLSSTERGLPHKSHLHKYGPVSVCIYFLRPSTTAH